MRAVFFDQALAGIEFAKALRSGRRLRRRPRAHEPAARELNRKIRAAQRDRLVAKSASEVDSTKEVRMSMTSTPEPTDRQVEAVAKAFGTTSEAAYRLIKDAMSGELDGVSTRQIIAAMSPQLGAALVESHPIVKAAKARAADNPLGADAEHPIIKRAKEHAAAAGGER